MPFLDEKLSMVGGYEPIPVFARAVHPIGAPALTPGGAKVVRKYGGKDLRIAITT